MKECPSCRARIQGNPAICPECGADLSVQEAYICTNCEQSFFGKRTSCPNCGSIRIFQKREYLK